MFPVRFHLAFLALPTLAIVAAGSEWKVDANARLRFESRDHTFTFNRNVASVTDDSWWLTRLRLAAKGDVSPRATAYVQLQDSRELGSDRSSVPFISGSEGDDPLDIRQAYLEFKSEDVVWRVGRQLLAFGDERLVGVSDWSNFARCFDAARVTWPKIGNGLDVFVSSVVQVQPGGKTGWHANHSSSNDLFAGIYSRFTPSPRLKLEPYLLLRRSRKDVVYSAGTAGSSRPFDIPQKVTTLGLRILGLPADKRGLDYDAELAGQTGEARGRQIVAGNYVYPGPTWLDHRAWAVHAGIGYASSIGTVPWRIYAEVNRASGDSNPADRKNESFFNLFPTNHKFYGSMDVFSWKNIREIAVGATTTFEGLKAKIEHHWFELDNVNDTCFRSNAVTAVRPLTAAARRASRRAGNEIDLVLSRPFGKHVSVDAGGSYFFAGPYLTDTGGATDAAFGYVQTTFQW
jgi:hypothetical protein